MNAEILYLGRAKKEINGRLSRQELYLTKHEFANGWYWVFGHIRNTDSVPKSFNYERDVSGHIRNTDLSTHFSELLHATAFSRKIEVYTATDLFIDPLYSDDDWWIIRDLFIQAYGLQIAADIYRSNGRQSSAPEARIIRSDGLHDRINKDIGKVLDQAWNILVTRQLRKEGGS